MLRVPLAPRAFLVRLAWFEFVLACLQLFHLAVLSMAGVGDFVAWTAVHGVGQVSLWALRRSAIRCRAFPNIPWRPLLLLLLVTFSIKLYSRMPYIATWLAEGLQSTRMAAGEDLADPGAASFVNIFFYPLALLAALATMPRRVYVTMLLVVSVMALVDFVFIGTRNAPVFVLLFHILLAPVHFRAKQLALIGAICVAFVAIFSYSTVNRTQDSVSGSFDWLVLFEFTKSTEILQLKRTVVEPIAQSAPALLPAVFLSHYLSHPIAELAYLVDQGSRLQTGNAYHLVYQLCVTRICSQVEPMEGIERTNPRAGVYQTIWGSLTLDFGLLGAALFWTFFILLLVLWQLMHPRTLTLGVALASQLTVLGSIENYAYNGLGLIQIACIFVACRALQMLPARKRSNRDRPALPSPALAA